MNVSQNDKTYWILFLVYIIRLCHFIFDKIICFYMYISMYVCNKCELYIVWGKNVWVGIALFQSQWLSHFLIMIVIDVFVFYHFFLSDSFLFYIYYLFALYFLGYERMAMIFFNHNELVKHFNVWLMYVGIMKFLHFQWLFMYRKCRKHSLLRHNTQCPNIDSTTRHITSSRHPVWYLYFK